MGSVNIIPSEWHAAFDFLSFHKGDLFVGYNPYSYNERVEFIAESGGVVTKVFIPSKGTNNQPFSWKMSSDCEIISRFKSASNNAKTGFVQKTQESLTTKSVTMWLESTYICGFDEIGGLPYAFMFDEQDKCSEFAADNAAFLSALQSVSHNGSITIDLPSSDNADCFSVSNHLKTVKVKCEFMSHDKKLHSFQIGSGVVDIAKHSLAIPNAEVQITPKYMRITADLDTLKIHQFVPIMPIA